MGRPKKIKEDDEEIVVNKQEVEPVKEIARVLTHDGKHIRIYTRTNHGDDFADLAEQMAAQHRGSKVILE